MHVSPAAGSAAGSLGVIAETNRRLIRQTNSPPAASRGSCCRLTAPESTRMPRRGVAPTSARAIAVTIAGAIAAAIASVSASPIASAGQGASTSVRASAIASVSSPVRASDSAATARRQQGAAELSQLNCIFHGPQLGTTSPPDFCQQSRARELAPFGPAGSACAAARTPAVRRSIPP